MPRPSTKEDLIQQSQLNFDKLWKVLEEIDSKGLSTTLDFSDEPKKKEAHWARDKDVKDVLIHLYEWHQLLLNFVRTNQSGQPQTFLPAPYNWRTYGLLNQAFVEKHTRTSLDEAKALLKASHHDTMVLVDNFSDQVLFSRQHFSWIGDTTLGSYFVSALSSHYDWAVKKLRAHIKKQVA